MTGRFEVFGDRAGQYRFRLVAANGQIVAASEGYTTRAHAHHGCLAVIAAVAPVALTATALPDGTAPIVDIDPEQENDE